MIPVLTAIYLHSLPSRPNLSLVNVEKEMSIGIGPIFNVRDHDENETTSLTASQFCELPGAASILGPYVSKLLDTITDREYDANSANNAAFEAEEVARTMQLDSSRWIAGYKSSIEKSLSDMEDGMKSVSEHATYLMRDLDEIDSLSAREEALHHRYDPSDMSPKLF